MRLIPVGVCSADVMFSYVKPVFLPAIYQSRLVVAVVRFRGYPNLVCDVTSRVVGTFPI